MLISPGTGTNIIRPEHRRSLLTKITPIADRQAFVKRFGTVFEHSPWIAEQVFDQAATDGFDPSILPRLFRQTVMGASVERQLALLRAHPELACALATPEQLTSESLREQSGAGLDHCSSAELDEFGRLNRAYQEKFGFPFIVAVRGLQRIDILKQFRKRLGNAAPAEFRLALEQVCKIGAFRLETLLRD